jgi:hypothetical protein
LDSPEETDLLLERIEAGELIQWRKDTQMAQHCHRSLLSDGPATPDVYLAVPPETPKSHKQPIPHRGNLGLVTIGAKNPVRFTRGARGHHLEARIVREAGSIEVFLQDGLGQEGEPLQHRFVVEVVELHFGPGKGFPVIRNLPGSLGQAIKPAGTKLPEMRRRAPLLNSAA